MDAPTSLPVTHDGLMVALAKNLSVNSDRMIWEDMQLGPQGSPRPDVYTIMKSFTRPLPTAYECKISVADFRSDITSGKWQKYLEFAGAVIFCVPKGLIQKSDIPNGCGLVWFYPESGAFKTVKGATHRPVALPQDAMLKLLIDGIRRAHTPLRAAAMREYNAMRQVRRKLGDDVADFVRNREAAIERFNSLQLQNKVADERISNINQRCHEKEQEAHARGIEKADAYRKEIDELNAKLTETLGLPADATHWSVRHAVQTLREAMQADAEVRRLSGILSQICNSLNNGARHVAQTVAAVENPS